MTRVSSSRALLLTLGTALALAGCTADHGNGNEQAVGNDTFANDMAADNAEAALPPEALPLPAGETAVVEDASTAPPIEVVHVPAPAPSTPAAEAEPLSDALAAERLIDAGRGITRVQQPDGWAWMQDGQIIRTASADGHRVSYFRPGSANPYLVQQDGRSYSYSNGRISREYDDQGRPRTPDAQHQREAQAYVDQARQRRDRAQQASKTAPRVDRSRDRSDDGRRSSAPSPSPAASQESGRADRNQRDAATQTTHNRNSTETRQRSSSTQTRRSGQDAQHDRAVDRTYDEITNTSYKSGDRRNREDGPPGDATAPQ